MHHFAAIHLAEDCTNAAVAVPRALMSVIGLGFITGLTFSVAMLYSASDFTSVSEAILPIFEIWLQATNGKAAVAFCIIVIFLAIFGVNAIMQTASRLTWSFARDDALIFSKFLNRVNPSLGVPIYALLFNQLIVMIIGCIYLGSTTAFAAIVGSQVVLQQCSFAIPILLLMVGGRNSRHLPSAGFRLGPLRWFLNTVTVAWTLLQLVIYNLPYFLPVTSTNMSQ